MQQLIERQIRRCGGFEVGVVTGNADQAEANDQHAGNRAALEGHVERLGKATARGLRRAHIGAHRDIHADVARSAREHCANHEAHRGWQPDQHTNHNREHDADDTDGGVLTI